MMLDSPEAYAEIPIAVAAIELGMTLNEMLGVVREGILELSFKSIFREGTRVSRDELSRAIGIGAAELLRIAGQNLGEIFYDPLCHLHAVNIEAAEKTLERMERFRDYSSPYPTVYQAGVEFIRGDFAGAMSSIEHIGGSDIGEAAALLRPLKAMAEALTVEDHPAVVIREQILAVAGGAKKSPFDETYRTWGSTSEYFAAMDENQRHAMFIANVIFEAIRKYKFTKLIQSIRMRTGEAKEEEFERVIRNAVFTALEAEGTYHESPSSRLFVDKFVELFPKRWIPAEQIALLPAARKPSSGGE
ncbi:MAG: hypothetical protein WKF92_14880 [Pyrinomonadaceae bacterium]